ncbi:M20 aminoacylase family protein [Amphibiibacter pelophylacis]|uniref:M20 aminoacylase family protein n=1 Tax=Amphibiibacter pelophylacis TaxID=1799477 RepID=A0ACC6P5R6_9BURK
MKLDDLVIAGAPAMTALRRDIHAHPELGFEETRTSALVAERLRAWGYEVTTGIAGTGVVGVLKNGSSPRSVGLRADMDALPMTEINTFEHASTVPGRMHGCGHDGHTAMLLSAAQVLAQTRRFDGTVNLVFQPAEEGGGGAREMVRAGLFERFPMDAIFGIHNWPGMAQGHAAVATGPVMGSSNEFRLVVHGKGGHAAMPHTTVDPVLVACQLVQALQGIITRNREPSDSAVLSVTMIHAGEATNVIPDHCVIEGTVRTFTLEALDLIEQRMRDMVGPFCAAFGASCEFRFDRNYPPTINHAAETDFVRGVLQDVCGAEQVHAFTPTLGAEDFSYFLLEKPGCYFVLGNGQGEHRPGGHGAGPCVLHNPSYDFNDALIPIGGSVWVRLAEKYLGAVAT